MVFGISPFGIWRSGVPAGIVGLDAYGTIYADATAWVAGGTVDYLAPQLYWPFGGGQDFGKLARWWEEQTALTEVQMYPGLALYRDYANDEVPRQLRLIRQEGLEGSILFRESRVEDAVLDESLVGRHAEVKGHSGTVNIGDHSVLGDR